MSTTDCAECVRLWQRYAAATTDHVSLIGQRDDAARHGDIAKFKQLEVVISAAERDRAKCKADIDKHEMDAHPKTSGAR